MPQLQQARLPYADAFPVASLRIFIGAYAGVDRIHPTFALRLLRNDADHLGPFGEPEIKLLKFAAFVGLGERPAILTRFRRACPGSERTSGGYIERPITPILPGIAFGDSGENGGRRFGSCHLNPRSGTSPAEDKCTKTQPCQN